LVNPQEAQTPARGATSTLVELAEAEVAVGAEPVHPKLGGLARSGSLDILPMVKPIRLTRHARNRMRWHQISEELIHDARGPRLGRTVSGRPNQSLDANRRSVPSGNMQGGTGAHRRDFRCLQAKTSGKKGRRVKIEYDPEADALYIQIREAHADDNIDIEEGVTVDVDENKHIVGLEILDASKRLSPSDLSSIIIQRLPLETTVP
jgi:uncharacterized protein YuzE